MVSASRGKTRTRFRRTAAKLACRTGGICLRTVAWIQGDPNDLDGDWLPRSSRGITVSRHPGKGADRISGAQCDSMWSEVARRYISVCFRVFSDLG
jgi:hypothetical protein